MQEQPSTESEPPEPAKPATSEAPAIGPEGEAEDNGGAPGDAVEDEYGLVLTALLPNIFRWYEKLCRWIATPDVHNLAYFLSTAFCAPVGLYIWEARRGGTWFRRLVYGLAGWFVLAIGGIFLVAIGWPIALVAFVISRPLRVVLKLLRLTKTRPAPDIPDRLTFEFTTLDIASLVFVAFIFLALVANRDDLMRFEGANSSDPAYHMAVARQILERGLPLWDRWEYAPFGRPHLYPPLLHLTIAVFSGRPDQVAFGFNTLQILLYPIALLAGWYLARWLFGPSVGLAALIFLSMDTAFMWTQAMVLPSAVVTALIPLILLAFMTRKTKTTIVLLTAALYTHGPVGVPEFVVAGLLVFCMRYRSYFPLFRKVVAFSFFLYLPWLIHVLNYADWLGTASGAMGAKNAVEVVAKGVVQLQHLSPVLLILAVLGWRRDKTERSGVVKCLLIGFVPMLLTYGGRYFMHTWPLWAVLAGRSLQGWMDRALPSTPLAEGATRPSLRRRIIILFVISMIPFPVVQTGMGQGVHIIPGITGANAALFLAGAKTDPDTDFEELAEFIRDTIEPDRDPFRDTPPPPDRKEGKKTYELFLSSPRYAKLKTRIVHIGSGDGDFHRQWGDLYFGDRIVVATGCRVDTGGWGPEVRSELMTREVIAARKEDPHCLFAFNKKEGFTAEEIESLQKSHNLDWVRRFGDKYAVGGRGLAGSLETF